MNETDPAAPLPPVEPAQTAAVRSTRRWPWAVAATLMALGGAFYLWGPSERNCTHQVDRIVIGMIASDTPLSEQTMHFSRKDVWQCYGQSENDMRRIGLKVMGDHMAEIFMKGLGDAFSTP